MKASDLEILAKVFEKYTGVQAVYLFGSAAAGNFKEGSDLDLAILPRLRGLREQKLSILADLARHGFCNVDLVFLDGDDIVLKYEAIRPNKVVYQSVDFDRGLTYSLIVRQYLDFYPYLTVQREAYKRRIMNGEG